LPTFTAFNADIEKWLELENNNLLQKICNIFDDEGHLVEQYKTRVNTVPIGNRSKVNPNIVQTSPAPSLYRFFNYDDEGNVVASVPEIREWTQDCEDVAQGADPDDPLNPGGVPAGLKVAKSTYLFSQANNLAAGANTTVISKTLAPGEALYVRHIAISGENRSRFVVKVNNVELQTKRLWWTHWNDDFWFNTANGGILFENEETIQVFVYNDGPEAANFEASIGYVVKQ